MIGAQDGSHKFSEAMILSVETGRILVFGPNIVPLEVDLAVREAMKTT